MTDILTPAVIGYIAGGLFVLAYLIIDQVALRMTVIAGTAFYIWYYFVAAPTPLWEAIYLSVAMGVANILGLGVLFARKSRFAIPPEHADIYGRFSDLPPGDFRALMKLATRRHVDHLEQVTVEGGSLSHLTYVISGGMQVEKHGDRFRLPAGLFVGEVAYITTQNSAASTWVNKGSEILQWDVDVLRKTAMRKDRFRLALEAMISKDLAAKVSVAVAPQSALWRDPSDQKTPVG